MLSITSPNASFAHYDLCRNLKDAHEHTGRHYKQGSSPTKEVIHAAVTISNPADKVVFTRPINPAFAIAEVIWILAGSNDLAYINHWNGVMKNFSDDGRMLHGAYGARLGCNFIERKGLPKHKANEYPYGTPGSVENQLFQAYITLDQAPASRQVVMNIYDHDYDLPGGSQPLSKDIPCNVTSILSVRDGKLHWMQTMRSNDLIWGTPYNFIQWMSLQEVMAGWLGVDLGDYTHVVNSLHVYEQHYDDLDDIVADGYVQHPVTVPDTRLPFEDSKVAWNKLADISIQLINATRTENRMLLQDLNDSQIQRKDFPVPFRQMAYVLMSETCRKLKLWDEMYTYGKMAGDYWGKSMEKWYVSKHPDIQRRFFGRGWAA